MQQLDPITLRAFPTPVVPRRRVGVGVSHQRLYRRQVDAGVKEIAGERSSQIVRREARDACGSSTSCQDVIHRLVGQPLTADMSTAPDPDEE